MYFLYVWQDISPKNNCYNNTKVLITSTTNWMYQFYKRPEHCAHTLGADGGRRAGASACAAATCAKQPGAQRIRH